MIERFLTFSKEILVFFGGITFLFKDVVFSLWRAKSEIKLVIEQIYQIGNRSLGLIFVTALSVGMVITLQSGMGLEKFGGVLYLPKAVTASILWELGPLFTGLMIAARAGAGMTSEIGSMMVTQQIDAMRALGTSPIQKIVIPRVVACFIAVPLLVAITNSLAIMGSLFVGTSEFNLDTQYFIFKIIKGMVPADYMCGFSKSFFFSIFISIPACYFGLSVREGAKDLGVATTKSVVVSSILILVSDFFLTKLYWMIR